MLSKSASVLAMVAVIVLVGVPVEMGRASPSDDHTGATSAADADLAAAGRAAAAPAHSRPVSPSSPDGGTAPGIAGGGPLTDWPQLDVPGAQPNIVVFYLDDTNPAEGRLWNYPARTPAIHDLFLERGVNFPNAIGETALCCPGRASLLTGLHTHNHGVTYNNVRLFNPAEHVGREMKRAGYDTFWIGKYMNHPNRLSAADWSRHGAGWTQLDVFRNAPDAHAHYYYYYDLFTKQGNVHYGKYHSTRMISDRAVLRMRQSSPETPLFMVLSIYNTHGPNIPMPEFRNDPRCAAVAPWKPPNYNEADVSDKPGFVRSLPLLSNRDGWPMKTMCEEMLGVDWLIKRVTDELAAEGRLDNTLLVFTADNGMAWGQHRLGQVKQSPYAEPVPLYMSWPARWGSAPRTIDDIAVNIDLAPTFCDLGGCTLGPYPGGQAHADGVSLLPLLDGTAESTGRDAVLGASYSKRPYTGLRTTPSNPLGRWHYIEYKDGFRELYDLANDPWELDNLAYEASTASLRSQLAARLAQLRREGRGAAKPPRADGTIAFAGSTSFVGNNIYSATAIPDQTRKRSGVSRGSRIDYLVRVQNDGELTGSFNVYAESSGSATMSVRYLYGGKDVTAAVTSGSFTIANLAPTTKATLTVRITVGSTAPLGAKRTVLVRFAAVDNPTQVDVVRAIAVR
jgi:arylsulfatase A-like enzyme